MNRRALLSAFLAAPVAVRLAGSSPAGWEVVDTGEWYATGLDMLRAHDWVFENHRVRIHGEFSAIDLKDCPQSLRIVCNTFELAEPRPTPRYAFWWAPHV